MLSVIVLTKNEEDVIKDCLESVKDLASEIIVVDSQSTDRTVDIAKKSGAKIYINKFVNFSDQRNFALSKSKGNWVLYLDADERATYGFNSEVKEIIKNFKEDNGVGGYFITRKTFFFDKDWKYYDKVQRLFYRKFILGWEGKVHETPKIEGQFSEVKSFILHFTHRDLSKMLNKTNEWSEFEADLRFASNHPKMSWWRFARVMVTGFLKSYFAEKGYKNGTEGIIESIYQSFSLFITYAKLWEKQRSQK